MTFAVRPRHVLTCLAAFTFAVLFTMQPSRVLAQLGATPGDQFRTLDGFEVELLHEVDGETQGSWVCMCVDLQGRLIVSDQYGKLYRVSNLDKELKIEELATAVGMAQGLLHTPDGLYVSINGNAADGAGIYRLQDTNGDDQFDKQEMLLQLNAGGEHGPHAIIPGSDGRLYFCAGNKTDLPKDRLSESYVPLHWSEDHLLGRMPDGRGFMAGVPAPGGFILSFLPDGSDIRLVATGFRNEYDIAFDLNDELFTYDADMEWDIGTPWYRPTRVNHVIAGAEFGWRNGTGKWPDYYVDSRGSVIDIGPGSPTGICFGTGAAFPEKYQRALYVGDWSYGTLHAVHMEPSGSSYTAQSEPFLSAAPMPITDVVTHSGDGNMYFLVGGRRVQSALYRVRYMGSEPTTAVAANSHPQAEQARALRHSLEALQISQANESQIAEAIEQLGSEDRAIQFAARVALEQQPLAKWVDQVLLATNGSQSSARQIILESVALARCVDQVAADQQRELQSRIQSALLGLDWNALTRSEQLDLLRAYQLSFTRFGSEGRPDAEANHRVEIVQTLDGHFPSKNDDSQINRELATLLVFLNAPDIAQRCVSRMLTAPSYEEQIHYALILRDAEAGWTDTARQNYFAWFQNIGAARGGASFGGFIENIRQAAIANLTDEQKSQLGDLLDLAPGTDDVMKELKPRSVVKEWTVAELADSVALDSGKVDFEEGQQLFAVAQCYKCHRFAARGGIQGPDLTTAGNRFSTTEMLTAIIEPNKAISDQYQSSQFITENGVITGRVANLNGKTLQIVTNMLEPGNFTSVNRDEIEEMRPSPVSMMPAGLIDTFTKSEIQSLLGYIKSGGNPNHPIYANGIETE